MLNLFKYTITFLMMLILPSALLAQGNLGQAGANFLQVGAEPRGTALGGAVTATASGAAALYWNPAGIVFTKNMDIMFAYTDWFIDTKLAYGGIVKNLGNWGSIGLSLTSFYMDEMEITTVYEAEGSNDYYEAGDLSVGATYARQLTDNFCFGITAKYVHERLWNETASQTALDIGSIYSTSFYNLKIGMAIHNVSGDLKFEGDDIDQRIADEDDLDIENNPRIERLNPEFRLPQVFHLGVAFDPYKNELSTLTLMADVDVPNDNEQRFISAMEYGFKDMFFLRGAYKFNYDLSSYSAGIGMNLSAMGMDSHFDYSFSDHTRLGNVNRFAFSISF